MSKKTQEKNHASDASPGDTNRSTSSFELSKTSASKAINGIDGNAFGPLRYKVLNPAKWLPNNIREFVRFFIFIIVLGMGSIVHIYLSAQILDAQIQQRELEQEYMAIQRQNAHITWEIAEYTSLDQIQQRAVNIGYTGSLGRSYAHSPISDDTLAQLGQTILNEVNPAAGNSQAQIEQTGEQVANAEVDTQPTEGALSKNGALAASVSASSVSASRIIESGLLEAIKVIDGR